MRTRRLLATTVWALTLGVVISVELILARLLLTDGSAAKFLAASALVAAIMFAYMRRLAPLLHRRDTPRWRMSPQEAQPVLPYTLGAFWLSAGVAASTYWPDWLGSAVGACVAAVFSSYLLTRLADREAAQPPPAMSTRTGG